MGDNKLDLSKLYKTQISLSEWFDGIGHAQSNELRHEDNEKRERLAVLRDVIGMPFDAPVKFTARDVADRSESFDSYLREHGDELCAMRLIPLDPSLPKLRMRGSTVREVVEEWFPEQHIDPDKYRVDFVPHCDDVLWSTIFIVNEHGIFGEIIEGTHAQLTQGFHEKTKPLPFSYDYESQMLRVADDKARDHLLEILKIIHVPDKGVQAVLKDKLNAQFSHDYLMGYLETITPVGYGIWFCDYNRILGDLYRDYTIADVESNLGGDSRRALRGMVGNGGKATGPVRIVTSPDDVFEDGDVLVCSMTIPELLPLMKRASAIVTDLGGVLCHAAIIARELGIPCIVGTNTASIDLATGTIVNVDADAGVVVPQS